MNWPNVFALVVSTAAAIYVSIVAWGRRTAPGARPLMVLGGAIAAWTLTYAIHFLVVTEPARFFWLRATYLGVLTVPTTFLVFSIQYVNRGQWLKKRVIALLTIEPVLTFILLWTDPWHNLFFGGKHVDGMILDGGPWFWINVIYSYGLVLFAIILLIHAYRHTARPLRGQTAAVLAGALLPWAINIVGVLGLNPFSGLDLTPFAFTITCICFTVGFSRYRLLDLVPIARDALIESMNDGVMVLDAQNRIVDVNRTALQMIGKPGQLVIGEPAEHVFANVSEIFNRFRDKLTTHQEIVIGDKELLYFDLRISPLYDRKGQYSGRLIVARDITERRLMEQAEHEQRVLAEALSDTAAALNSSRTFEDVLDRLLDNLGHVVPYDMATFMLLDEHNIARVARSHGYREHGLDEKLLNFPVNEIPNFCTMMETGQALVVPDTHRSKNWVVMDGLEKICSYAGAPLQVKGEVIGFLDLTSLTPNFYNQTHADRLQAFSDQVAIAIENARLFEDARQRADELSTLLDIGLAVTSGLEMDKLLKALLEKCKRVLPIEAFYIATYDNETEMIGFPLFFDKGEISVLPPHEIRQSPGLTGYIIQTRQMLYLPDALAEEVTRKYKINDLGGDPSRSYVGVPLLVGERVVGVISMQSSQPNAYHPDQIRLLETIATQAAGAIENARLFEEVRLRAEEMTALFDIGITVTSGLDMEQVLRTLLEKCRQVLPVEAFYIAILDPDTGLIHHPLAYDMGEYPQIPTRDIRQNPGLSGHVINNRQTLYIPDITNPDAITTFQIFRTSGTPTRAYVGVPMIVGDRVVGVISMQSYQPNAYDPGQIRLLETIATQAAVAIENSRLYAKAQQEIRQREKAEHRYRALFEQSHDAVFILDVQGKHLEVNQRASDLLGYTVEELMQLSVADLSAQKEESGTILECLQKGENIPLYERVFIKKNGEKVTVEINAELVCDDDGAPIHIQSVVRDISERKQNEVVLQEANQKLRNQLEEIETLQAQLREQATRDSLTGLFNRRYLEETLVREFLRAGREKSTVCLVMMDIDGFKAFNDTYGHDAGDLLLRKLGEFLRSEVRSSDFSCRYGGEEFLIVMPGALLEKGYERAEHLRAAFLSLDIEHLGVKLCATLSIGVAIYPQHGDTSIEVLHAADQAMYAAKVAGRNCTRTAK
ncbi:MAG: GAF domain-containing protein [Chloroflexi bacterium]|nr:GAF domain-containing protein [Chloroflexota bacterium]